MKYKGGVSLNRTISPSVWRMLLLFCLVLLCQLADAQDARSYMIMAPKVFRLAAQEKVVVQLFGYTKEVQMHLVLKSSMAPNAVMYNEAHVTLNSENSYQAAAMLQVPPDKLITDATQIILRVTSNEIDTHESIPITRQNGYLFVQTDKPLYTPEQSVKVRAFALREDLTAAHWNVFLTFRDPFQEIMDTVELNNINGIPSMQDLFKIPLKPRLGLWSIEASFKEPFTTTATTQFEVKEYVLPSISIGIQPEDNFICHGTFEKFNIKITARYINGAAVSEGIVYLKSGYVSKNGDPVIIANSIQRGRMTADGEVEMTIDMKTTLSSHDGPKDLQGLKDKFLYLVALVSELTGGISQEAELATVKFVESPYTLSLVATSPFIKPSLPYTIRIVVKDHLGEPVAKVPVRLVQALAKDADDQSVALNCDTGTPQNSDKDGVLYFICNTHSQTKTAEITFRTADSDLPPTSQTEFVLHAKAYFSPNGRYLYINSPSHNLDVGSFSDIEVIFQSPTYLQLTTFSFLVISKGNIVHFASVARESDSRLRVRFEVKPEMAPSFRLLVYYILYGERVSELVADSVWISVNAKCINNLKTELSYKKEKSYKPNQEVRLQVRTGGESLVALSAIDTALYTLRVKHLDPMTKVLRHIERADLGCGGGGGKDSPDVFRLAGLTFMTNANAKSMSADDDKCEAQVRPKRSAVLPSPEEVKRKILGYGKYYDMCRQGLRHHPQYDSCKQRADLIKTRDKRNREVFEECCLYAQQFRPSGGLSRSNIEIDFLDDDMPTYVRSFFPESWLWEVQTVKSGDLTLPVTLPDSLTTWQFHAVAMFPNGLCVAPPQEISVSQLVSVDVPLPYSMVRGEQIELQGSVYNNDDKELEYCVTLTAGPGVCLFQAVSTNAAGEKTTACKMTRLSENSVQLVSFTLLALEAGSQPLTFKVRTRTGNLDAVTKNLRVVPEGILTEDIISNKLDPKGIYGRKTMRVELDNKPPCGQVPHTTVDRQLTISGEILGEVLSILTDPRGLEKLLKLPWSTPEAAIFRPLPYYYVFQLMEAQASWPSMDSKDSLSPTHVKNLIKQGFTSMASFRQKDGSYRLSKEKESSTWLTALAVNAMGQVYTGLYLDKTTDYETLYNSVGWLVRQAQNSDGSFTESSTFGPVKVMRAGGDELEQSVYLTSFVLIGLINAKGVNSRKLKLQEFAESRKRAAKYISQHASGRMSMYVRAVAAYSLLLDDLNSIEGSILYDQLETQARRKGNPVELRYWQEGEAGPEDQLPPQTVEITCYVLLSSLLKAKTNYALPIISWLTKDQHYLGGFQSIQEMALVLHALTKYDMLVKESKLDMNIYVSYIRGNPLQDVKLDRQRPVATPIKLEGDKPISLSTGSSTGVTVNKLKTVYYKLTESSQNCNFDISINVLGPDNDSKDPRRQTPRISACAKYKPLPGETITEAGLTRMEIQLPTGVEAFRRDLDLQLEGIEEVMSEYNMDGDTLIIFLPAVPSDRSLCVAFRIHNTFKVGMASDAQFRVFENQDRGSICSQRYSPLAETKIQRLCVDDECRCMSAECSTFRADLSRKVTVKERVDETCRSNVKYAFKVEIKSSVVEGDFVIYMGKVVEDLKTDETESFGGGTELEFIKKVTCDSVDLKSDAQYLVMVSDKLRIQVDKSFKYRFILDAQALVEIWPTECGKEDSLCSHFVYVLNDYEFERTLERCP